MTHRETASTSSGQRRYCYGDFRPDDGGAPVVGVRVHISGGCKDGRTAEARLLRMDTRSWLIPNDEHRAYAGTGATEPIVVGVLMGLFCLIVGGPFLACAVVFPGLVVITIMRRRAADHTD